MEKQSTKLKEFFERCGLDPVVYHCCYAFTQQICPGQAVQLMTGQGYCSLTFLIGSDRVVQFRPAKYRLDLRITQAAADIYGSLAPKTRYVGTLPSSRLLCYTMDRITGICLEDLRIRGPLATQSMQFKARLCRDLAGFMSKAWHNRCEIQLPRGTIGNSISSRLQMLIVKLPVRFQAKAEDTLAQLHLINALPWVLSHGDITASNIMISGGMGTLTGMVDWAEAELLPFGVCLYGLDEILGQLLPSGFQYFSDASLLRKLFWDELTALIPDLREESVFRAVGLARTLGVLLWHGFAYDDGAIDRVVEEGRDTGEIYRLDAFLAHDLEEYLFQRT